MAQKTTVSLWVDTDHKNGTPVITLSMDLHAASMVASGFAILGSDLKDELPDEAQMFAQVEQAIALRFGQLVEAARALEAEDAD